MFFSCVYAQVNVQDTLLKINQQYAQPAKKLEAILRLSHTLRLSDFNERMYVADQGIFLATVVNDSLMLGEFYGQKGNSHYFKGNYDSAAHYYFQAINILEKQSGAKLRLAHVLNELGKLYRKKREFTRSINAYDRALALFVEQKDSAGISMINNESGVVYEYMGDYDEAMRRYKTSLNINERINDDIGKSYAMSNIGYLYITLKDYKKAEKYLSDALKIRIDKRDTFSMALSYTDLGELYIKEKKYAEALGALEKSNLYAKPMRYLELQMTNHKLISEVSVLLGNYKAAYINNIEFTGLKDSIYRLESASRIEEISTRYETEKKASENELLKKTVSLRDLEIKDKENQNRIQLITTISMAIIFFLALGIGLLIFFRIRREQQIRLQTEVNTARETERRRISRDLHDHLGAQMSYMISVLDKAEDNGAENKFIPALRDTAGQAIMTLRETVWAINKNEISVENFGDKFKQYAFKLVEFSSHIQVSFKEDITQDRLLGPSVALNLYRLCQEAFSNAVKHANAKQIVVTVKSDAEYVFYFSVADDGDGFDPERDKKDGHYGLENMSYRAEEAGAIFNITSSPGKGTTVEVFSLAAKQNQP